MTGCRMAGVERVMPEETSKSSALFGREAVTPPGWVRTARPLSVAVLGWARLSEREREGSGYNLVASELAAGLAMSGHRVSYLRSGADYALRPGMHIRRNGRYRGVECAHLVNSPNAAPGLFNFRNMSREMRCKKQTRLVMRWLDSVGADVVHIHSLEGFSLDVIEAIKASGRGVVVTPHNYWFVCPQVDLLHKGTHVCMDYAGGRACEGCMTPASTWKTRWRRKITQMLFRRTGPMLGGWIAGVLFEPWPILRSREARLRMQLGEEERLDPELARGMSIDPREEHSGELVHDKPVPEDITIVEIGRSELDTNERFLGASHHLTVLNGYGQRRWAGVQALRQVDRLTPPSVFCGEVHVRMGVEPERVECVRLGLPHLDRLARRSKRSAFYDVRPWDAATARGPLRLAFFGTVRHQKGIETLVRAITLLPKAERQRCQFLIRAALGDWLHRRRLSRFPEVSFLGGYDMAQLMSSGGEYDVGLLPHIWFENSPLVMLEFLSSGKFVVASRLGGPPEWVVEPGGAGSEGNGGLGNGLLVPGGQPEALAGAIGRLVRGEVTIPSPREVHAVSLLRDYPSYVAACEGVYQRVLDARRSRGDTQA
ncbi:MAG: glycosyltransferase [Phycisphaeraceae bacterium]|nr:glycosyltransferase [Phycisphaeraceae bacterium]